MENHFILDATALIGTFPEPTNMRIIQNDSEYLYIHHKDKNKTDVDMCSLELSCDHHDIELRLITISEDRKYQGFGKKVIMELIYQCQQNKLNLYSDLCYQGSIAAIRSAVRELDISNAYEEYQLEEDGEFRFYLEFETCLDDTNITDQPIIWSKYLQYLRDWTDSHSNTGFYGCTPACFDEWLVSEYQEE